MHSSCIIPAVKLLSSYSSCACQMFGRVNLFCEVKCSTNVISDELNKLLGLSYHGEGASRKLQVAVELQAKGTSTA